MALSLPDDSHAAHVEELTRHINRELPDLIDEDRKPAGLYEPMRYVLQSGGKRIRPLFVLLSAEAFGVSRQKAMPAALAVELFHNFTLVHDDIMDQSDERRGRSTVHKKWNVSTAILCGDLLLALSYNVLVRLRTDRLADILELFHHTMECLCEGQTMDKAFETRADVTVDEYIDMIERKTGALLQTALELGALLGDAAQTQQRAMRRAGHHIGRAFQIQDDLLDLTATDSQWGKPIGGDLVEGKKTYVLLHTLQTATGEDFNWFQRIIDDGGLPSRQVSEARRRMDRLGILAAVRDTILHHYRAALDELNQAPAHPSVDVLRDVIHMMKSRVH